MSVFKYNSRTMAEALLIVSEHGINGLEYNWLLNTWPSNERGWVSRRMRWSLVPPHKFTGEEFEEYMILAWRFGLLERSRYKEVDWLSGLNKSSYPIENEIIRLTRGGWEFTEKYGTSLLQRWVENVLSNLPTVILSAFSAVLTSWAILYFGASD